MNAILRPLGARSATLAIFQAYARHPQTPLAEVEARLLDVCERERDMDMYPLLLAGLREVYRIEAENRPMLNLKKRRR